MKRPSFFKNLLTIRNYFDSNFFESEEFRIVSRFLKRGGRGEKIFVEKFSPGIY